LTENFIINGSYIRTLSRTTSTWAKCIWSWVGYWKYKSHK